MEVRKTEDPEDIRKRGMESEAYQEIRGVVGALAACSTQTFLASVFCGGIVNKIAKNFISNSGPPIMKRWQSFVSISAGLGAFAISSNVLRRPLCLRKVNQAPPGETRDIAIKGVTGEMPYDEFTEKLSAKAEILRQIISAESMASQQPVPNDQIAGPPTTPAGVQQPYYSPPEPYSAEKSQEQRSYPSRNPSLEAPQTTSYALRQFPSVESPMEETSQPYTRVTNTEFDQRGGFQRNVEKEEIEELVIEEPKHLRRNKYGDIVEE